MYLFNYSSKQSLREHPFLLGLPVNPGWHLQSDTSVLPVSSVVEKAGHFVQSWFPNWDL